MSNVRSFDLKEIDIDQLCKWLGKIKSVMPDIRIVIDILAKKVFINYGILSPNQQFLVDLMLVEIT
jgi:hypothetical protein